MPRLTRPTTSCPIEQWQLPDTVGAIQTERTGGVSKGAYQSLNLGLHVQDEVAAVTENRQRLLQQMPGCKHLHWLNQVHGTALFHGHRAPRCVPDADASVSQMAGHGCVIMTADCLPVLFCANDGSEVAAAHAGWRGLALGVLEQTIASMKTPASALRVWLGPCIGPLAFEVGDEVRTTFTEHDPNAADAFAHSSDGKWLADIQLLAVMRLAGVGVHQISADLRCTYQNAAHFFSYRRACQPNSLSQGVTGRMASAIWIKANA
ncbi:peptidoglycan editing factor PgeF [Neiella marina]|uniref:Purine nucleoside phosphorylase n=1 Tax=Neiella holothuriorum TaxID=2870530 RepID=A0ABS7EJE5_9GAMM|nr:peptidoglycan editing factor PgeF [Neiella holothuriorum]MBW8191891.1 peptidoglycan editing factor PgeF [Neiella holothuriorum]